MTVAVSEVRDAFRGLREARRVLNSPVSLDTLEYGTLEVRPLPGRNGREEERWYAARCGAEPDDVLVCFNAAIGEWSVVKMNGDTAALTLVSENEDDLVESLRPGIYRDLGLDDYRRIDAVSWSTLQWAGVSLRHMKAALKGQLEAGQSPARRFGRAVHSALLDPEDFRSRFATADPCSVTLSSGPRRGERCGRPSSWSDGERWFCGTHRGVNATQPKDFVSGVEAIRIGRMIEAMQEELATASAGRAAWSGVTLVWERHGIRLKCRLDRYSPGVIIDVRKAQAGEISDAAVIRSIERYGCHRKLALQSMGIEQLTGDRPECLLLFAEDDTPFDINLMPLDAESISIGVAEVDQLLMRIRDARAEDRWPGVLDRARRFDGSLRRGGLSRAYRLQNQTRGLTLTEQGGMESLHGTV